MTRRERMINILYRFGRQAHWSRDRVLARMGYDAFTDEAIDMMALETVKDHRLTQRMNRRNREIYARAKAAQPVAEAAQ